MALIQLNQVKERVMPVQIPQRDERRTEALKTALAQIEKQFGKGSIMRLGSDTKLDVMLDAQRRYTAKSSRKKVIDDIQGHAADQMYYVYTPYPKNLASWTPWVKNYQPKNSFDRGAQLEVVWIEK